MSQDTLLKFLISKVGVLKAAKIAGFIAAWGMYSESIEEGGKATIYGCGQFWKRSQASMYREIGLFRRAFPDDHDPERVWQLSKAQVVERQKAKSDQAAGELLEVRMDWGRV